MEALAAAAAQEADTDAAEQQEQQAQAPASGQVAGKKRGRGTKVESAEKKLQDLAAKTGEYKMMESNVGL